MCRPGPPSEKAKDPSVNVDILLGLSLDYFPPSTDFAYLAVLAIGGLTNQMLALASYRV